MAFQIYLPSAAAKIHASRELRANSQQSFKMASLGLFSNFFVRACRILTKIWKSQDGAVATVARFPETCQL
jgi:hypothetical protein